MAELVLGNSAPSFADSPTQSGLETLINAQLATLLTNNILGVSFTADDQVRGLGTELKLVVNYDQAGTTITHPYLIKGFFAATVASLVTQVLAFMAANPAGSNRVSFQVSNEAETGTDAGSRLLLRLTLDNGSSSNSAIALPRQVLNNAAGTFPTISVVRPVILSAGSLTSNIVLLSQTSTWNFAAAMNAVRFAATDTASDVSSLLLNLRVNSNTITSIRKDGYWVCNSNDDLTGPQTLFSRSFTLTGNLTDPFQLNFTAALSGAFTVTRYDWIELDNPTGAATVTDAAVYFFNAAAGTHVCIDTASTKTSPGTVSAWDKYDVNGTLYYSPCYTSKTS